MAAVNLMWSAYQIRAGIVKSIGVRGVVRGEATTKIRKVKKKKKQGGGCNVYNGKETVTLRAETGRNATNGTTMSQELSARPRSIPSLLFDAF